MWKVRALLFKVNDPSPAYIGPAGSPLILGTVAGAAVFLGAWLLFRRRHEVISLLRGIRDEGEIPARTGLNHSPAAEQDEAMSEWDPKP